MCIKGQIETINTSPQFVLQQKAAEQKAVMPFI